EERPRETLERRADGAARRGIAGEEALLQRAVAREHVARRQAKRCEVARPVEAIDEAGEAVAVASGVEVAHEPCRRRAHHPQHALPRAAEQHDTATTPTRRRQP